MTPRSALPTLLANGAVFGSSFSLGLAQAAPNTSAELVIDAGNDALHLAVSNGGTARLGG